MNQFVTVAREGDLPDPGRRLVEVDDTLVVLIRAGGSFYALDDVCTHDGGPLAEGELLDHAIACPRHGARFDLRTGRALSMPATQPTRVHEVRVVDGQVQVRLVP
jgi:3-phenylpropionate/trans-cinnamate dioxygenase ferredoxin subunit